MLKLLASTGVKARHQLSHCSGSAASATPEQYRTWHGLGCLPASCKTFLNPSNTSDVRACYLLWYSSSVLVFTQPRLPCDTAAIPVDKFMDFSVALMCRMRVQQWRKDVTKSSRCTCGSKNHAGTLRIAHTLLFYEITHLSLRP